MGNGREEQEMAFGKNPADLNNVGSFRAMGHAWNQKKQEQKDRRPTGGSLPSWVNEYKPPTDGLDLIRILPGEYYVEEADASGNVTKLGPLQFWPFAEHYDSRTKKRAVCSGGAHANNQKLRSPCPGCDLFFSSMKFNEKTGKRERGFMGRREMIAFSIIHYRNYHKVPQIDQQGNPRVNPNTKEPYYSWLRCFKDERGRGKCDHCDAGFEMKFGHRMHWPMGADHYNTLLNKADQIANSCANCGGRNTIQTEAWVCGNPECEHPVIDSESNLKPKEIAAIVKGEVVCPECKEKGFLKEYRKCDNCDNAKRAEIFDVDLNICRVVPADGSNRTTLDISSYSDPHPIDKALAEIAKPEKLNLIYAPTSKEIQEGLFGVAGGAPRAPVTAATAARPYGNR